MKFEKVNLTPFLYITVHLQKWLHFFDINSVCKAHIFSLPPMFSTTSERKYVFWYHLLVVVANGKPVVQKIISFLFLFVNFYSFEGRKGEKMKQGGTKFKFNNLFSANWVILNIWKTEGGRFINKVSECLVKFSYIFFNVLIFSSSVVFTTHVILPGLSAAFQDSQHFSFLKSIVLSLATFLFSTRIWLHIHDEESEYGYLFLVVLYFTKMLVLGSVSNL